MRLLEIAEGVELCNLARDLTGEPNWQIGSRQLS